MKLWEAMKSMQEGKKVKASYWDEDQYLIIKDGSIVNENGRIAEISFADDNWEIYDDRKEAEEMVKKLYQIVREIDKNDTEYNNFIHGIGDYNYAYLLYKQLVLMNKKYKLDK